MKKSYETPKLSHFGNVADLTTQLGRTVDSDNFGGSMAFPGQGQGSGNNNAGGGGR